MKKAWMALLLVAALAVCPMAAFASDSDDETTHESTRSASSNSRSGGGGGGGGGSSTTPVVSVSTSSSSTENGIVEVTNTVVTDPLGVTLSTGASYTRLSDGVVTAFVGQAGTAELEAANPTTAYVAVGESKLAGLPQEAVTIITQLDQGSLYVPGLDLSGYRTYGTSVAVRAEAGAAAMIYCSEVPASGAQILFYNNWAATWSLIPCTVDYANNTVTFMAPTSGTAIIIGV